MERINIGMITKPQALKGEFRLKPTILNLKEYKKIKEIIIDNQSFKVEKVTLRDTFVIMKVVSIDTCEQAEFLRNKQVFADLEQQAKEDNFNLVDYVVFVENKQIGVVTDINNYGSKDILSVSGEHNFMLPVIDKLMVEVNDNNKIITLNKEVFEQVVVYED